MTNETPPEVLALARKVIDDIPAIDRDGDFALKISIAAIMEVTERAAKMLDHAYPVAEALRNWEHLK